jgi:2,3-bisphosphoglycerate-dependent phosphoglycerate mutase
MLCLSDVTTLGWVSQVQSSVHRHAAPRASPLAPLMQLDVRDRKPFWAHLLGKDPTSDSDSTSGNSRGGGGSAKQPAGTLILLRHGDTEVGRGTTFIGWSDPDLSKRGCDQTTEAARAILEAGYSFDCVYTSVLKRAVRTAWLLLQQLDRIYLPVNKNWRLNERCYGALTAEPIDELRTEYGAETVASWRRSFDTRPPPFPPSHPHNPAHDPRYTRWQDRRGQVRAAAIPNGEHMGDTITRVLPAWKRDILPELRRGKSVLVVAHGNTIRALVQAIDDLSDAELCELEVPPCIPLVYRFERKGAIEGALAAADRGVDDAIDAAAGVRVLSRAARALRGALGRRSGQRASAKDLDLVAIRGEHSASPLSGEYLAQPAVVARAQESVRLASRSRCALSPLSPLSSPRSNLPSLLFPLSVDT